VNGIRSAYALTFLRVVTGIIFITHGWPKLAGGVGQTADFLGSIGVPLPIVAAWGVTLLETFGGLALVLGALTAPVAILLAIHMLLGILLVHMPKWYVLGPGTGGSEYNLLLIAVLTTIAVAGPGAASIGSGSRKDSA